MTNAPRRPRFHVLALAGSIRPGSFNAALVAAAVDRAPAGMSIDILDGLGDLPHFDPTYDDLDRVPPTVARMRERVAAANGMLISTPEYNHSIPGVLKNALDWLSRPSGNGAIIGLPIAITGVTTGPWGTRLAQAALRQTLTASEALVLPQPSLFVGSARDTFGPDGNLADQRVAAGLEDLLRALGEWIEMTSPGASSGMTPRPTLCRRPARAASRN